MNKFLNILLKIVLYIWQLPQNIAGIVALMIYSGSEKMTVYDIPVYYNKKFPGGVSLGNTVIVYRTDEETVRHEHGHQIQSLYLGWLYLFVIGIPSLCWYLIYGTKLCPRSYHGYYKFYTESWANKLGGVVLK